tara:strand:- start:17 stop:262 length:246 start_codon:yes stop_codon:yes gene_type:complete
VTPFSVNDVPEVLDVHEIPSDDEMTVPVPPTDTKILLPNVTPFRSLEVPDVLEVHEEASEDVLKFPDCPTVTKILFPYSIS